MTCLAALVAPVSASPVTVRCGAVIPYLCEYEYILIADSTTIHTLLVHCLDLPLFPSYLLGLRAITHITRSR